MEPVAWRFARVVHHGEQRISAWREAVGQGLGCRHVFRHPLRANTNRLWVKMVAPTVDT